MAQTPIVLLATDYLLKGEGLVPSKAVTQALAACGPLRTYGGAPDSDGTPDPNAGLDDLPIEMVLSNVEARIERLLGPGEQGIRRFISIFQSSSGASGMTTGTLDAAAALKKFKSFSDFGPGINNIQDLVTGGKTGAFPGGAAALTKLGEGLRGFGSMYDTESLADLGKASSLVKNLGSQGALPESVQTLIAEQGIDLDNPGPGDEANLKKLLSSVNGSDLESIGSITGFPVSKLGNLGDALDASKVLPPEALAAIPKASSSPFSGITASIGSAAYSNTSDDDLTYAGDDHIVWDRVNTERVKRGLPGLEALGYPRPPEDTVVTGTQFGSTGGDMSSLGTGLQTVAGTGNFSSIGKKLSGVKVPELKHLMADPPDFSQVGESLKAKFTTVSIPIDPPGLPTIDSMKGGSEVLQKFADKLRPPAPADGKAYSLSELKSLGLPAGFEGIDKLSIPTVPGHIPNIPSIPGVPSMPLEIPGFAPGGAIDTSLYTKTADKDLTYTGDDHIVWDRVNTERLNRGLPDLAAIGSPRPAEPPTPPTATPNGTPGVFQMMGTISSEGPILPHLQYLAQVSNVLPNPVDVDAVSSALANIQVALDQELGALTAAGIDLSYPGPTGYMGVTMFAEKLHQYGVDKTNLGLGRFIEDLAESADSKGGDSIIAALYEGRNLVA